MTEALPALTVSPSGLTFQPEWITHDIVKVSLCIEHSLAFKESLSFLRVGLPTSLSQAAESRQCEFMAGRACVKWAMYLLGDTIATQPQVGKFREPIWQDGYCGSISHSATIAVAMVAENKTCYLGIDRQEWLSSTLAHSLASYIVLPGEHKFSTLFSNHAEFVTAVFSAKESLFKAMFPSIKRYVDFSVAELCDVDLHCGRLKLKLTQDLSCYFHKGRQVLVELRRYSDDVETIIIEHW